MIIEMNFKLESFCMKV